MLTLCGKGFTKKKLRYPVVTIGNFDGVHTGHQKIIQKALRVAEPRNGEVVVLTFRPHPEHRLSPGTGPGLLTLDHEKEILIKEMGISVLWFYPFTIKTSRLTAEEFMTETVCRQISAKEIVIGQDHRLGRKGEGTSDFIRKWGKKEGIRVHLVLPKKAEKVKISSTWVRKWLHHGDIHRVNRLLGHPYMFSGKVIKGHGVGRTLGFPTANIRAEVRDKLLPGSGVYFVRAKTGRKMYDGALFVGKRETFLDTNFSAELHFMNFKGDLYGRNVLIYVVARIRDIRKFKEKSALAKKIKTDLEEINKIKQKNKRMLEVL